MRVLVPLPFDLSNAAHGRNLRVVHVLRGLNRRCELLCLTADDRLAEAARRIMPDVEVKSIDVQEGAPLATRATRGGSRWMDRVVSFLGFDERLAARVCQSGAAADVVLGFDMPSVAYLAAVIGCGTPVAGRPRVVCDLIDDPWLLRKSFAHSQRWSPGGLKAAAAVWTVRRRVLPLFDSLIAIAPRDARSLSRAARRHVAVIPNGVDTPARADRSRPREMMVVFTGGMNFPSNEAAACFVARRVWPLVLRGYRQQIELSGIAASRTHPLPTLAIVGADPTPRVQRLGTAPNVIVTGRVASVHDWLERARVAVAPMVSGCGIKNKILEACAAGCPVVSTPLGASGLPMGEENGIVVGDGRHRLASEIVRMLRDPAAAERIGSAGRSMVGERFSWSSVADAFVRVLRGGDPTATPASRVREADEPLPAVAVAMPDQECADHEEALTYAAS